MCFGGYISGFQKPLLIKKLLFSALIVTILWRTVTTFLTWYLSSGFIQYDVIYGSLSTTIVSLFWLYLSNYTILFGAHLCATLSQYFIDSKEKISIPESAMLHIKNSDAGLIKQK